MLPDFLKSTDFLKAPWLRPLVLLVKSNVQMKMVECYEQGENLSSRKQTCPISTFYTTVNTGINLQ